MATTEAEIVGSDFLSYRKGFDDIIVGGIIDRAYFAKEVERADNDASIVEPLGAAALISEVDLPANPDN